MDMDANLTNASHIGTALMATNSYRALGSAWVIMGLLPVVFFLASTLKNDFAYKMTDQLQAINLVASDISSATCSFLFYSTSAWLSAVVSATHSNPQNPYLLFVDVRPYRCLFNGSNLTHIRLCQIMDAYLGDQLEGPTEDYCTSSSQLADSSDSIEAFSDATGIREGSMFEISLSTESMLTVTQQNGSIITDHMTTFSVTTRFDQTSSIRTL